MNSKIRVIAEDWKVYTVLQCSANDQVRIFRRCTKQHKPAKSGLTHTVAVKGPKWQRQKHTKNNQHNSSLGFRFITSRRNATINSHCAIWSKNCAAVRWRERHLLAELWNHQNGFRPQMYKNTFVGLRRSSEKKSMSRQEDGASHCDDGMWSYFLLDRKDFIVVAYSSNSKKIPSYIVVD